MQRTVESDAQQVRPDLARFYEQQPGHASRREALERNVQFATALARQPVGIVEEYQKVGATLEGYLDVFRPEVTTRFSLSSM